MSDLIDRQVAIEYIKLQKWRRFDGMTIEDAILTMIREVPSAQPEIIRCKDCKHGMYDMMCKFYWCHGMAHSANWFCADGERRTDEQT